MPESSLTKPRPHLTVLDGIRGVAALYVVLHHAYYSVVGESGGMTLPAATRWATVWLTPGHYAVVVFIVLSGYCLMLPLVRTICFIFLAS